MMPRPHGGILKGKTNSVLQKNANLEVLSKVAKIIKGEDEELPEGMGPSNSWPNWSSSPLPVLTLSGPSLFSSTSSWWPLIPMRTFPARSFPVFSTRRFKTIKKSQNRPICSNPFKYLALLLYIYNQLPFFRKYIFNIFPHLKKLLFTSLVINEQKNEGKDFLTSQDIVLSWGEVQLLHFRHLSHLTQLSIMDPMETGGTRTLGSTCSCSYKSTAHHLAEFPKIFTLFQESLLY